MEFEEDDKVYLKISPMKEVVRIGKTRNLSPRYVGPYEIWKMIGNISYELRLPSELSSVHLVFHVSMLKKCIGDPESILPMAGLGVMDNLSCKKVSVKFFIGRLRS